MPGAQPRRSTTSRMAASARRGANVPAGVPGVYRVPRRVYVATTPDNGSAGVVSSEWVTPDPTEETQGFALTAKTAQGSIPEFVNNQPEWETSLDEARAGTSLRTAVTGIAYYSEGPEADGRAVLQQTRGVASFAFPPTSPTPPPGMTVEYEDPAGTAVGDVTVDGVMTTNITNSLGELDNTGLRFHLAPVDDTWYTPAETGALTLVGTVAAGVYNEADATPHAFSFTVSSLDADVALLMQGWAAQNGMYTTVGAGGGRWSLSSISATRMYQPPRYRFV